MVKKLNEQDVERITRIAQLGPTMYDMLVGIRHQLVTDSDLESVTCPEKYKLISAQIAAVEQFVEPLGAR